MPKAVVSQLTERFELDTLPPGEDGTEGGWVELRRLSYGEKMRKDSEAMKMRFGMDVKTKDMDAEISIVNELVTLLEFAKCIVSHNLTKADGETLLDFKKEADVRSLDPQVGEEISNLIGRMNDFESEATTSPGRDDKGK
jgi:hypothetical protein